MFDPLTHFCDRGSDVKTGRSLRRSKHSLPLILSDFVLPACFFFKRLLVALSYLFGLIRAFWFYLLFLNNAAAFRAFIRKHLSFRHYILYQHRTAVCLFAYFGEYGLSGDREKGKKV